MPRHNRAPHCRYPAVGMTFDHLAKNVDVPQERQASRDRQDLENLRVMLIIVAPDLYARLVIDGPYLLLRNGERFEKIVVAAEFQGGPRVFRWESTGEDLGQVDEVGEAARLAADAMGITRRGM